MNNVNLQNYLKKIYEIEKFLYTQKLLKESIENKIHNIKEWRPQEEYSLKPSNYKSIKEGFWGFVIGILCIIFMGWVGIKITETGFHDTCFFGLNMGWVNGSKIYLELYK